MDFIPTFPVGATITHAQLCEEFKCGNMGGMRRSNATNSLIIISDHTKSLYDDKWFGSVLHYTGMGKIGDQALVGNQNRTLAESNENGVNVHLFEVLKATEYIYHGKVKLVSPPYQEIQNDINGDPRKVWMFPLQKIALNQSLDHNLLSYYTVRQEARAQSLSPLELESKAKENSTTQVANRPVTSNVYVRDPYISEYTKHRAAGKCQLCEKPAPFKLSNGKPYLETHHVIWLANGGADSIENTVALCPNCHRKMHLINNPVDVSNLLNIAKE